MLGCYLLDKKDRCVLKWCIIFTAGIKIIRYFVGVLEAEVTASTQSIYVFYVNLLKHYRHSDNQPMACEVRTSL